MPRNKTTKSKPPVRGATPGGIPRPRGTSAKPAAKGSSGMIGRAQASLPGRKPPAKKSPLKQALSALSPPTNIARKPSKKGLVGGMVGAAAVAAMAKRRRGENQDELPTTPPSQPAEAHGEEGSPLVPPVPPVAPPVGLVEPTAAAAPPRPIEHATDSPEKRKEKTGKKKNVEIPKEQIVQMLHDRGDHDQAQQADQQLPEQVDPEQHRDLLGQIGINPSDLPGGAGKKLGL